MCLFCGDETPAADHSFQKLSITKEIHDKAVSLGEDYIVSRLAEGDLVAIEAKYHWNCGTVFNRRYREMNRGAEQVKAENMEVLIENELIQFINEEVAVGAEFFSLKFWQIWWKKDWSNMTSRRQWIALDWRKEYLNTSLMWQKRNWSEIEYFLFV
jgi:hypothetical protein